MLRTAVPGSHVADAEQALDAARTGFTEAGAEAYVLEEIIRRCEWLPYCSRPDEAYDLAVATIAGHEETAGTEVSRASRHRMAAYAKAAGGDHAAATEHVDASLALAQTADFDYERVQTLEAGLRIEGTNPEREKTLDTLLEKLGIVARPWLPLRMELG